ncbi:type III secretion system chaperone [Pantoea agglomerans]|uniref:type III secretion system chaperone n=1 Tax=Enterobacter agglomerans TaxID=549 RepID=UPI0007E53A6F|nr:type III secretion system chaperone [Pantoea agglomerans]WHU90679.1 type III secretion system chaperone [Pantoea agglomerans pv. gypsophilae]
MTPSQQRVDAFLQHFAASCKTPLHLKEGVCPMYTDQGEEAAVLEVPEHSDCLLLHCELASTAPHSALNFYALLLQLNFEMAAMRGCWLALDEQHKVRLCFQQSLAQMDETNFSQLLSGFIAQAGEVREYIGQLTEYSVT